MTFNMSFQAAARDAQKKYLERLHQVDWAVIIEQAPFSFFFFLFLFVFSLFCLGRHQVDWAVIIEQAFFSFFSISIFISGVIC